MKSKKYYYIESGDDCANFVTTRGDVLGWIPLDELNKRSFEYRPQTENIRLTFDGIHILEETDKGYWIEYCEVPWAETVEFEADGYDEIPMLGSPVMYRKTRYKEVGRTFKPLNPYKENKSVYITGYHEYIDKNHKYITTYRNFAENIFERDKDIFEAFSG